MGARLLKTRRDTAKLGRAIGAMLAPGDLVILSGDLGAGKTFLTRAIARELGVGARVRITSPTFTLVQEYETDRATLLHVDLHRVLEPRAKLAREVRELGLRERLAEGCIAIVEWGEAAIPILGNPALVVTMKATRSGVGREVAISGSRARELA